jgi:ABC-type dipeptide/oligopeptide/nickel transport system permease component
MNKKKIFKIIPIFLILFVCVFTVIKLEHRDIYIIYFHENNKSGENLKAIESVSGKIDVVYPDDFNYITAYLTEKQAEKLKANKRVREIYKRGNTNTLEPI